MLTNVLRMSVAAGSMFKWLDLLEKEFDRSFVQLDLLLGDIDQDQEEITNDGRFCFTVTKGFITQFKLFT